MVLKSFEAIYDHGKLIWKDQSPGEGPFHLIVTVLPMPEAEDSEVSYSSSDVKWQYGEVSEPQSPRLAENVVRERSPELVYGLAQAYGDDEPFYTEADIKWRYDQAT